MLLLLTLALMHNDLLNRYSRCVCLSSDRVRLLNQLAALENWRTEALETLRTLHPP